MANFTGRNEVRVAVEVVAFTNELFLIASGDTVNSAVGWSTLADGAVMG